MAAPSLDVSIPSSMIRTFFATPESSIGLLWQSAGSSRLVDTVLPDEGLNQFGVERKGIVISGYLIGTERYRREQVCKITRAATSMNPALMKLLPWATYSLLRHCVSARAGYIARVSEIGSCFLSLAQLLSTLKEGPCDVPWFFLLRSIPLALGGLGIPRQAGIDGETAYLLSWEISYLNLESHYPGLIFWTRAN